MRVSDLRGKRFGKLIVVSLCNKRAKGGGARWLCKCDCGNEKEICAHSLVRGLTKSCGCNYRCKVRSKKIIELKGKVFGLWTVLEEAGRTKNKQVKWLCECSCGAKRNVTASDLISGKSKSCGCYHKKLIGSWAQRNPERNRKSQATWRANNKKACREFAHRAARKRLGTFKGKINARMAGGIYYALKENKKGRHWETLVEYTLEELMNHIENLFQSEMTWDNMGQWHLDHIKPKAAFNFEKPEDKEFKECWCLENLQPLWKEDNLKKGSKY